jgi:hypothetical protein
VTIRARLFEGLTAIIDYCHKNNFENSVSDELLDKINMTVFKVIDASCGVSPLDIEKMFNVIKECFKERAEPVRFPFLKAKSLMLINFSSLKYTADYHLELNSKFLCDPELTEYCYENE